MPRQRPPGGRSRRWEARWRVSTCPWSLPASSTRCVGMYVYICTASFLLFVSLGAGNACVPAYTSTHQPPLTTTTHHLPPQKKHNTSPNQPTNQQSFLLSTLSHALLPHLSLLGPSDAVGLHPLAIVGMCGAIASAFSALPVGAFRTKGVGGSACLKRDWFDSLQRDRPCYLYTQYPPNQTPNTQKYNRAARRRPGLRLRVRPAPRRARRRAGAAGPGVAVCAEPGGHAPALPVRLLVCWLWELLWWGDTRVLLALCGVCGLPTYFTSSYVSVKTMQVGHADGDTPEAAGGGAHGAYVLVV